MSNQWISVKERLPERGQFVIVYSPSVGTNKVFEALYTGNPNHPHSGWSYIGWGYDKTGPTHWQPMPKPPKP